MKVFRRIGLFAVAFIVAYVQGVLALLFGFGRVLNYCGQWLMKIFLKGFRVLKIMTSWLFLVGIPRIMIRGFEFAQTLILGALRLGVKAVTALLMLIPFLIRKTYQLVLFLLGQLIALAKTLKTMLIALLVGAIKGGFFVLRSLYRGAVATIQFLVFLIPFLIKKAYQFVLFLGRQLIALAKTLKTMLIALVVGLIAVSVWCLKAFIRLMIFMAVDVPKALLRACIYLMGILRTMLQKMKDIIFIGGESRKRAMQALSYWVRCVGPVVAVVALGGGLFGDEVYESIASTPHPSLVYTIFGALFGGVLYCSFVLQGFIIEEGRILSWGALESKGKRKAYVEGFKDKTAFSPVYSLMNGELSISTSMRQSAVEGELDTVERTLVDRLNFPNYLAGALVGIGLIGTFVGLLGTLADLGKLFESLGGSANANADAAALFGDMVQRLQAPMKGMGTAFVASLYGLLGSLMLGLMVLSVKSIAVGVVEKMRTLVHQESYGADADGQVHTADFNDMVLSEFKETRVELAALNKNIELLIRGMSK